MKKYKLLIVPSDNDEAVFEDLKTYEEADQKASTGDHATDCFTFDTEKEREIFIQGYLEGIGYLGNGLYFTTEEGEEDEQKDTLKKVNQKLYDILVGLHSAHVEMEGTINYPEKDREWISDTLDIIEIKYFAHAPDGDRQKELSENKEPMLSDEEAYREMATRLINTRI